MPATQTANSPGTEPSERPHWQFQPGQSGNPNGRPKGIARQLREAIQDDPTVLTGVFLNIALDPEAKPADRIAAGREYLDRAYGKAPSYAPVDGGDPLELGDTDRVIADVLDELAGRRKTPSAGRGQGEALERTGT